ncbi:probable metabotropic glutamate receptor mgl-1 [Pseudophryne corroboree]|uniref:probable metabotropic glutamate receptor mgl-1 n=1 Tax=Pseudophryne corroboree TaxID=495146 RepID=UPI003081F6C6
MFAEIEESNRLQKVCDFHFLAKRDQFVKISGVNLREYQQLQAFILAIDDINSNPEILPNVTLGYHVHDSCGYTKKVIKDVLKILSGPKLAAPNYACMERGKVAGFIGDIHSVTTLPMAQLLNVLGYTQISYGARDPLLSDRTLYPNFFRTVQNYQTENVAIAKLLRSFGWNWVGIITSDDDNGERELQHLSQTLNDYRICIEFKVKVPQTEEGHEIPLELKASSTEIVVMCGTNTQMSTLFLLTATHILINKTFILTASWSLAINLLVLKTKKAVEYSLVFSPPPRYIPALPQRLFTFHPSSHPSDPMLEDIWIQYFRCLSPNSYKNNVFSRIDQMYLDDCAGKKRFRELFNYTGDPATYQVYIAVLSMVQALHEVNLALTMYREKYNLKTFEFQHKGEPEKPLSPPTTISTPSAHVVSSTSKDDKDDDDDVIIEIEALCELSDSEDDDVDDDDDDDDDDDVCLRNVVNKINYTGPYNETIYFDEKGEYPEVMDIENWSSKEIRNQTIIYLKSVGRFNPNVPDDQQLLILPWNIAWKHGKVPQGLCTAVCLPGTRRALRKGSHTCCYDCIPCSEGEISNVSDSENCQKCADDEWSNEYKDECIPRILEFLSYKTDMIAIGFSSISVIFFILSVFMIGIFVSFRDTPIVKANNRNISFILLISLKLNLLCVHLFIGHPVDITCMLRQISFGILFTVALSSVLAKTVMVCIAFKATKPGSSWRIWLGAKLPNSVVFICSCVQVLTSVIWLSVSPPNQQYDMESSPGMIIIQCNDGSILAFCFMLGYMGILAALSFVLAFMVRTLPDIYNEAKYITFSMLLFCSVWVCAIPAYLSSKGKQVVIVEVFAILASGIGILSCIFFPKCYNILLRPEINSKTHLLMRSY